MTPAVRSRIFDGLVVLCAGLLEVGTYLDKAGAFWRHGGRIAGLIMLTAAVLALLVRRRRPVQVLALAICADIVVHATGLGIGLEGVQTLVALYSCGRYRPVRTGWIAVAATLMIEGIAALVGESSDIIGGAIVLPLTVALGQYVRLRGEMTARRREEAAASAVRLERRRIARELHDVVAHHISVMSVLVGAARTTMTIDPERAAEALSTTERTAREALEEMRRLLSVLRADGEDTEPATGARAAQVPELVAAASAAGLRAELAVHGTARDLPASVDLAVYRVVQEALTNTRKHASGAHVSVRLRYELAAVDVEILDDGGSGPDSAAVGSGYGLGGMAERVALCGGRLQTGSRADGGFRVHARIPVPAALPSPAIDRTP
jgi:signal transduction histidine kinase